MVKLAAWEPATAPCFEPTTMPATAGPMAAPLPPLEEPSASSPGLAASTVTHRLQRGRGGRGPGSTHHTLRSFDVRRQGGCQLRTSLKSLEFNGVSRG